MSIEDIEEKRVMQKIIEVRECSKIKSSGVGVKGRKWKEQCNLES